MVASLTPFLRYRIALDSDAAAFGGHGRLDANCEYLVDSQPWHDRPFSLLVSIHDAKVKNKFIFIEVGAVDLRVFLYQYTVLIQHSQK